MEFISEQEGVVVIDSPGRINIIGEHIDYNDGFVLPTAIDKKIRFKFRRNGTESTCKVYSKNIDKGFEFDLENISPSEEQWHNYILGVIHEILKIRDGLKGFDCEFDSGIPIGSGISSSAALECGIGFGLNELFKLGLSRMEVLQIGQWAEHRYVGTKCGIMDQFASVMSKENHVILLDCKTLDFEYVPFDISPYSIVLLNTNVSHNLASGEYNKRRSECEQGLKIIATRFPDVSSFRDVKPEMLEECRSDMDAVVFNRSKFVVEEISRVHSAVNALKSADLELLGKLMYQTHDGLSQLYEVSCEELDFLVNYTRNIDDVLGSRVMGGGFGGCTINLVHDSIKSQFVDEISKSYLDEFGIKLTTFEGNPSEGTIIVQ